MDEQKKSRVRTKSLRDRIHRRSSVVFCVAAATLVVTACSSSSHTAGTSGSSTTNGGSSSQEATGSTWTLGAIITQTGQGSSIFTPAKGTLEAWEDWTNAHGGIDGHKIQVDIADDQNTPSIGLAAAQKLVNADHIIAMVGSDDNSATGWGPYITKQNIPIVGAGGSVAIGLTGDSDFYPPGLSYSLSKPLELQVAKLKGDSVVGGVYCAEATACLSAVKLTESAATSEGLTNGKQVEVSSDSSSYVAPCLTLKQAGVQAVTLATDTATQQTFVDDCAQQGYYPLYLGDSGTITTSWTSDPAYKNAGGVLDEFPWWQTSNPAVETFTQALDRYYPAGLQSPTTAAEVWASAMTFEAGADAAHLGDSPTAAEVTSGLDSLSDDSLGGLIPPLTYTNGNRLEKCGYLFEVANGAFTLANNGQAVCGS